MAELDFGWGGGGWGSTPWGTADPDLELLSAQAIRENVVRLEFSAIPLFNNLGVLKDAARLDHYSITAVSGIGLDGEPVRPVTPVLVEQSAAGGTALDITVDRSFTAWPALYRVTAVGLVTEAGSLLLPGATRSFQGLRQGEVPQGVEDAGIASRDIANPQSARDLLGTAPGDPNAVLGTYQIGPTGDYVNDTPFASYRKRVIRRLTSLTGGFAHLQGYGVGAMGVVKRQATMARRELLASQAEQQIKLEPETLSCKVQMKQEGLATFLIVRARTTLGAEEVSFPVQVSL